MILLQCRPTIGAALLGLLLVCAGFAHATNYYVDCNYGSNGNPGTSPQQAWRTLLEVGAYPQRNGGVGFQPGDTINLLRDCTWNETLTPPSSGSNGSLIKIDSYGNGQPPHLTGYLPIAARWWTQVGSSNVWAATLYSGTSGLPNVVQCGTRGFYCLTQPPTQLQYVRFGTTWGTAQGSEAALSQDRDFWYDATNYILYVYSAGGNPAAYSAYSPSVAPIALSGESLLNVNGVSWLEIQHVQIDWFDAYGVQVQGASDHLWLANMAADSEVENSTVPLGFYVHPSGTPVDIHLYNTDANMNYAGYHFDGCSGGGCAFEIKNCRAYAIRAYGIVDNVQGAVSYDYCHLYANNLATALTVDTSGTPGPTAGSNNVPAETPPWVREWHRWPAYTTVSYDDPGLVQYSDTYVNSLLPIMSAKGIPLSIAVVTNGTYSQSIIGEVQGWISAGWDINTHSVSHEYWSQPGPGTKPTAAQCAFSYHTYDVAGPISCDVFVVQYTGASTVTMTITHNAIPGTCGATSTNCLTINSSPYDPCAYVAGWDLTPTSADGTTYVNATGTDTVGAVIDALSEKGNCWTIDQTALQNGWIKGNAHSIGLADVSNLSLNSQQLILFNESYLETDEMGWAKSWMSHNFTGLPSTPVYIMPGTYGDAATETIANSLGFKGVRGTGSLTSTWVVGGADATLAKGYDAFNILSQGVVPNYQGLSYQQMRNRISQELFKNALWGRPIGYFWHVNELRPDEVENLMDALVQGGATLESNTRMVNLLLSCQANDVAPSGYVAGSYYVCPSSGTEADFRPTVNSPAQVKNGGFPYLVAEYQYDLMGISQNSFGSGWGIGAYVYVPENFSATH